MALTLAVRLETLFKLFLKPRDENGRRKPYENLEFCNIVAELDPPAAKAFQAPYLSLMRSGKRANPGSHVVTALARGFAEIIARSTGQRPSQRTVEQLFVYIGMDADTASPEELATVERIHQGFERAIEARDEADRLDAELAEALGPDGSTTSIDVLARIGELRDPNSLVKLAQFIQGLRADEQGRQSQAPDQVSDRTSRTPAPTAPSLTPTPPRTPRRERGLAARFVSPPRRQS